VFEHSSGIDPVIVAGQPERSFYYLGLSLLLPYLEPYLIRSMRAALERTDDAALADEIERFNAQEGQHYRQHMQLNRAVRMAGFPFLAKLEAELEEDYRRYTSERSLRFNLAYAEGFEAWTLAVARYALASGIFEHVTDPGLRDVFTWHMVEEIEHRTVAFDTYERLFGGWLYRVLVAAFAQWHLNQWILRVAFSMLWAERARMRREFGGWRGALRRGTVRLRELAGILPRVAVTYSPRYSPRNVEMPPAARELAERYTRLARAAT